MLDESVPEPTKRSRLVPNDEDGNGLEAASVVAASVAVSSTTEEFDFPGDIPSDAM